MRIDGGLFHPGSRQHAKYMSINRYGLLQIIRTIFYLSYNSILSLNRMVIHGFHE